MVRIEAGKTLNLMRSTNSWSVEANLYSLSINWKSSVSSYYLECVFLHIGKLIHE